MIERYCFTDIREKANEKLKQAECFADAIINGTDPIFKFNQKPQFASFQESYQQPGIETTESFSSLLDFPKTIPFDLLRDRGDDVDKMFYDIFIDIVKMTIVCNYLIESMHMKYLNYISLIKITNI